jgi:hypothetical protein
VSRPLPRLLLGDIVFVDPVMSMVVIGPVLDPGKGVCADPRRGDAILGVGGPRPPMGDNEHQLSLDRGGEKT